MNDALKALVETARKATISPKAQEEQRRSFAYGNTKIENDRITRQTIDEEAEALAKDVAG